MSDVEEHNRRELWRDVANHLTVARQSTEHAQEALEDLKLPQLADMLQPTVDTLRQAALDAEGAAE